MVKWILKNGEIIEVSKEQFINYFIKIGKEIKKKRALEKTEFGREILKKNNKGGF